MNKSIIFSLLLVAAYPFSIQAQRVLSLSDCRAMSKQQNKSIQMAAHQTKAATELKKAAKTQYLPRISALGSYLNSNQQISLFGEDQHIPVYHYNANGSVNYANSWNNNWTVVGGNPVPLDADNQPFNPQANPEKISWKYQAYLPKDAFEFDMKNIYVGSVSLTQPLFMGGKIQALNQIAESGEQLAKFNEESKHAELLVSTDVSYWRIVSLSAKNKLAENHLNLLKKVDSNIKKAVETGLATKSEALSIQVKLNEAELSKMQVEHGLKLSKMVLAQQCGLPIEENFVLVDESFDKSQSLVAETKLQPITPQQTNRPEIKSLEAMTQIAAANEKIAKSRFLPNAILSANYLVTNPNMSNGISKSFDGHYQLGVVVSMPIYHFGERVHTLQSSREEKQMAQLQLEEAKEKIQLDIQQASFKLTEAIQRAKLTLSGQQKSEENLQQATIGYETGSIETTTLMEAQTAWLKACTENIDAQIDIQICKSQLEKSLGSIQ